MPVAKNSACQGLNKYGIENLVPLSRITKFGTVTLAVSSGNSTVEKNFWHETFTYHPGCSVQANCTALRIVNSKGTPVKLIKNLERVLPVRILEARVNNFGYLFSKSFMSQQRQEYYEMKAEIKKRKHGLRECTWQTPMIFMGKKMIGKELRIIVPETANNEPDWKRCVVFNGQGLRIAREVGQYLG